MSWNEGSKENLSFEMEAEFLIGREISSKECGQIGSCKYKTKPGQPSELWDCLVEFVIQKSLHTLFSPFMSARRYEQDFLICHLDNFF